MAENRRRSIQNPLDTIGSSSSSDTEEKSSLEIIFEDKSSTDSEIERNDHEKSPRKRALRDQVFLLSIKSIINNVVFFPATTATAATVAIL